jgi:hypothetical protein
VRAVVVHGHYYQPPREDPWLEVVVAEANAAPFHDWNVRIERECYRAVVAARLPGADGRIARIVNALSWTSFDFGPTLLEWLEREAPDTYAQVLAADRESRERVGFGNAMASPYHHVILPLGSRRDVVTEVRWGIADFRRRFGRVPEGMWLPETAVDDVTLDVLAEHGVAFTIVAPHQVARPPARGLPGLYRTGTGREIALFVYDGALSHDVAFGVALKDGSAWARRMLEGAGAAHSVVSVATDGETFGHHHRFAEMALARMVDDVRRAAAATLTNFAAVLAKRRPSERVSLVAPSSWSCVHGVDRWRADCGCRVAPELGLHQRWRAPLRGAVEWLAGELHALYDREAEALLTDPWAARDACGELDAHEGATTAAVVAAYATRALSAAEVVRARELLEMERNALRLFTSCAWFFDDVGGLEPLQVLRYAARAIELSGAPPSLEAAFVQRLAAAQSNDPSLGDAARIYRERARPALPPSVLVAGSYAATRGAVPGWPTDRAYAYDVEASGGEVRLTHRRTGRAENFTVCVERPTVLQARVTVAPAGSGAKATLQLGDLLERERSAVVAAGAAALAARLAAPDDVLALGTGAADLATVAERALLRAVRALATDRSPGAAQTVSDLLDLFALRGWPVPFDAQTAFGRWRSSLPDQDDAACAVLASRLGFAVPGDV